MYVVLHHAKLVLRLKNKIIKYENKLIYNEYLEWINLLKYNWNEFNNKNSFILL